MKELCIALIIALAIGVTAMIFINPFGTASWNTWIYHVRKADDTTNYNTRKQVEDTCRAMIASYKSDKLMYEQYASSMSKEKKSWGEQAKMRANTTAAQYNEYVLKNSFFFDGNVPKDIRMELEYIS